MSRNSEGLQHHAKKWNTGHSSTSDLEEAAISFARSVGPVGEQDMQDLRCCIDFRVKELKYALEPRNARYLASLGLTGEQAGDEAERLRQLRGRVDK